MDIHAVGSVLASALASPLLLAVACCASLKLAAAALNFIWSLCAAYLLRQADFWTMLLPEKTGYWRNRVAWVTGSSSGVGLSLCRLLAHRGCRVIMSSRKIEDLQAAKQDVVTFCSLKGVQKSENDFLLLPFDLLQLDTFEDIVVKATAWAPNGRIDFLFNNAGIASRGLFMSYEAAEKIIKTDLLAQMKLTKLLLPIMSKAGFGHIIFTNSGRSKLAACGHEPYSVSKVGLLCFAEALSRDLKAKNMNIFVTSALPSYIRTKISYRTLGPDGTPLTDDKSYMHTNTAAGLPPDTVARYMLKAASNKLRECWIATTPVLFYLYLQAYLPDLASSLLDLRAKAHALEIEQEAQELEEIAQRVSRCPPHST
ncbi:UNVERIFIED_CONTAM: oxidoreductase, short chain dehydrogenase/reductase family protein [Hammondia hammondi]|eukprot:XP_008883613.1 oxidoreductase, short chain dehydrogenase/reductase family protein [Hammondia hammondi]